MANGDSNIWKIGRVYGDKQDISQRQLATLISGQLVQCMEISRKYHQWQLATPVAGQTLLCMEIHRIYHSDN